MSKSQLPPRILIGISSCLLGDEVRFDGGHKKDQFIVQTMGQFFDFYKVCPEVDIGLGVPRPPIRLEGTLDHIKVVGVFEKDLDVTKKLSQYSNKKAKQLPIVSGYILKSKSPTCGMERVAIYGSKGPPQKKGIGVFANALMHEHPSLPVEEEGRLNDPVLRENFIERVFVYRQWQELVDSGITPAKLVNFHTKHKLTLMAHKISAYKQLGQRIAKMDKKNLKAFAKDYIGEFMEALKQVATCKRHTNVLQHCMGYLKKDLTKEDKQELLDALEQYHQGLIPLIVPITLLHHYFRLYPNEYMAGQSYLNPYPREFMLRNLV